MLMVKKYQEPGASSGTWYTLKDLIFHQGSIPTLFLSIRAPGPSHHHHHPFFAWIPGSVLYGVFLLPALPTLIHLKEVFRNANQIMLGLQLKLFMVSHFFIIWFLMVSEPLSLSPISCVTTWIPGIHSVPWTCQAHGALTLSAQRVPVFHSRSSSNATSPKTHPWRVPYITPFPYRDTLSHHPVGFSLEHLGVPGKISNCFFLPSLTRFSPLECSLE